MTRGCELVVNYAVPVYEYEPTNHDCLMCEGRIAVIQGIREETLSFCPWCGLDVRRVVSRATIKVGGAAPDDKNSRKGFTTFRRAEKGVWEKVSGDGPDVLAGSQEDIEAVEAETRPVKPVIDLDKDAS